jgi:hypothetical protein
MEKIQYSLIYMLYKTKFYKSGKTYLYRANQMLAGSLTIALSVPFMLVTNVKLKSSEMLIFLSLVALTSFLLLEKNTTKSKIIANRHAYRSRRKYLIIFYIFSFIFLVFFVLLN